MAYTYEDKSDVIDYAIAKRRARWRLQFSDMDFDDVSQLLRIHIFERWDKWDQSRPLENWVHKIITNKLFNLTRDHYKIIAPPCADCNYDEGSNRCGLTPSGEKCGECPFYEKWAKKKKYAYNIRLAGSIDEEEYTESPTEATLFGSINNHINFDCAADRLHKAMKEELNEYQYNIYQMLFIDGLSDTEVSETCGFKTTEDNRAPGYKQLLNIKKNIINTAKKVITKYDII